MILSLCRHPKMLSKTFYEIKCIRSWDPALEAIEMIIFGSLLTTYKRANFIQMAMPWAKKWLKQNTKPPRKLKLVQIPDTYGFSKI